MAEEHFGIGSEPHGAREFPKMVRQAHRADAPEYFYTIKEKADPELRPMGPTDRALGEYATAPDYRGAGVLGRSRKRPDHPKHLFSPHKGTNSREAPANLKPVGTGPYRFVDFEPGDLVKGERNPAYHVPNRPYFDTIELKGGGDAVSAARAVIQTGDYDFAWNTQVEDEILLKLENSGNASGHIEIVPGMAIEHIQINTTDPWTEVDGERSSVKTKHPLFADPAVRQALRLLVDSGSVQASLN